MNKITRKAGAVWEGNLHNGRGEISTESKVLYEQPYTFCMRFENEPGTNPEELIAAAHSACYCMALAGMLNQKGYHPVKLKPIPLATSRRKMREALP